MTFRVRQKVVCVDDSPTDADGTCELTLGTVYTVRWVGPWKHPSVPEINGVRLAEIDRGPDEWTPEVVDMPFRANRFRPIVEDNKRVSFTLGADPESERWDNRKKQRETI
jgi:hypothetical protein